MKERNTKGQFIRGITPWNKTESWTYFPELRYEVSNGKTLCEPCHSKTDNYKGRGRKINKLASENSMRIAVATL